MTAAHLPLLQAPGPLVALHLRPWLTPWLPRFLGRPVAWRPRGPRPGDGAVVGWGLKGVSLQAREAARRAGRPYLALEDGFLRSLGLGDRDPALALVLDDEGIYYDASAPSRLERLIARPHDAAERARAEALAALWRQGRLSKYNHPPELAAPAEPHVLVVDQTWGDASITHGGAGPAHFVRMLEAALEEHPHHSVLLKVHPDVVAGRRRGHFDGVAAARHPRVRWLAGDAHPPALIEAAAAIYTVTSQMGFEALLWGRPLRCFGLPFYAGWGLGRDDQPAPPRRAAAGPRRLADLVHAALIDYPRCLDPQTLQPAPPETLLAWLAAQRRRIAAGASCPPGPRPRGNPRAWLWQGLQQARALKARAGR